MDTKLEPDSRTDAQRIADDVGETLATIDAIVDAIGSDGTRDDLAAYCEEFATADDARQLLAVFDELGGDDGDDVWGRYINGVLDVEIDGRLEPARRVNRFRWELTRVALLITFGGPTVRVISDGGDSVLVRVDWWSDHAERRVVCGLAGFLFEYGESVAEYAYAPAGRS
jgi:hypothetical protein